MNENIVVVTGAASGLGRCLALRFARQASAVLIADMDHAGLESLRAELVPHCQVAVVTGDLRQAQTQRSIVEQLQTWDRGLHLLVNNAGITHRSPIKDTDVKVFSEVMTVDWQAPVELTHALLPALMKVRGGIINIGSMAGWMPVPGRAAYCAAKAALAQFFEVLRLELEADGIRVLNVYPSFLATNIESNALGADGKPARHARSTVGQVRDADWMAARIQRSWAKQQPWLFGDRLSVLGSLLWRIWPAQYLRSVRRRFAVELGP